MQRSSRRGLSLLEVLLAIAILGLAMVMIGQLVRIGVRSAINAQQVSHAQILCDAKMAEVSAGVLLPESVTEMPIEEAPGWTYSIDVQHAAQIGLLEVTVLVRQSDTEQQSARWFSLTRLVPDPHFDPFDPTMR